MSVVTTTTTADATPRDEITAGWDALVAALAATRAESALKYGRTIRAGRAAAESDYPALVWSTMTDAEREEAFRSVATVDGLIRPASLAALTFGAGLADLRANILHYVPTVTVDTPDAPTRTPRRAPYVRPAYVPTADATAWDVADMARDMTARTFVDDEALAHDRSILKAYRADVARGGYPAPVVKGGPRVVRTRGAVKVTVDTPAGPVMWWRVPFNARATYPAGSIRSERNTHARQTSLMGTVSLSRPVDPTDAAAFDAAIRSGEKATGHRAEKYVDVLMSDEMYVAWIGRKDQTDAERMRAARATESDEKRAARREKDRIRAQRNRDRAKAEKALMASAYVAAIADAEKRRA